MVRVVSEPVRLSDGELGACHSYDADASDWFEPPTLYTAKEEIKQPVWISKPVTLGKKVSIQ